VLERAAEPPLGCVESGTCHAYHTTPTAAASGDIVRSSSGNSTPRQPISSPTGPSNSAITKKKRTNFAGETPLAA